MLARAQRRQRRRFSDGAGTYDAIHGERDRVTVTLATGIPDGAGPRRESRLPRPRARVAPDAWAGDPTPGGAGRRRAQRSGSVTIPSGRPALRGHDVVALTIAGGAELDRWERRLKDLRVEHTHPHRGRPGWVMDLADPDGIRIRLRTHELASSDDEASEQLDRLGGA
jgi:hypothetical protein